MDYKFTFEDGSMVLAHSGVKGMKWGVWNDETKAKYGGTRPRKTEAERQAAREIRNQSRKTAAAYGAMLGGMSMLRTGNPVVGVLTFGAAYASSRISSTAARKGRPLVEKLVKDPAKAKKITDAAEAGLTIAGTLALRQAGAQAVTGLLTGITPTYSSTSGYSSHPVLSNIKPGSVVQEGLYPTNATPKPHAALTQPSNGIASQLSNANIPDSLKKKLI